LYQRQGERDKAIADYRKVIEVAVYYEEDVKASAEEALQRLEKR
jgi:hypothetical protein